MAGEVIGEGIREKIPGKKRLWELKRQWEW